MNKAILDDCNSLYLEAIDEYEKNIGKNIATIDDYTNLAFLYWAAAFEHIEFNVPNNIPESLSVIGGERFSLILNLGLHKYPDSLEINFWNRYLPYRLYQRDFSEMECKKMIEDHDDNSLIPYFFLNLFNNEAYTDKIDRLIKLCLAVPTAKHNYIISFLTN